MSALDRIKKALERATLAVDNALAKESGNAPTRQPRQARAEKAAPVPATKAARGTKAASARAPQRLAADDFPDLG